MPNILKELPGVRGSVLASNQGDRVPSRAL